MKFVLMHNKNIPQWEVSMVAGLPTSPTVNISLVVVEAVIEVVVVVEVVVAYHVLLLPAGPTVNMSLDPAGV